MWMVSQHWFRLWLGVLRKQAITLAKVDPNFRWQSIANDVLSNFYWTLCSEFTLINCLVRHVLLCESFLYHNHLSNSNTQSSDLINSYLPQSEITSLSSQGRLSGPSRPCFPYLRKQPKSLSKLVRAQCGLMQWNLILNSLWCPSSIFLGTS